MKYLFIWLFVLSLGLRAQEIRFVSPGIDEAKKQARERNQLIFVDLFAEWCGPCKAMERSVFTQPDVASHFNENFVNLRITIDEPSDEALVQTFGVREFPSYLFLNDRGELVHKIIGFHSAGKLLAEARKAERKFEDFVPMQVLTDQYESGKRETSFLYDYLNRKFEMEGPQPELLDTFLVQVPESELNTEKILSVIAEHVSSIDSRGFEILSASLDRFPLLTDSQQRAVLKGIGVSKRNSFLEAVKKQDEQLLESLIDAVHATSYSFEAAVAEERQFRYDFAKMTRNFRHFRVIAMEEASRILALKPEVYTERNSKMMEDFEKTAESRGLSPSSGNYKMMQQSLVNGAEKAAAFQLNEFAEGFLLMSKEKDDLLTALKWSASAIKLNGTAANWKTYALLLNKLGRKGDARKALRKAAKVARKSEEDPEEYKKLLKEI